MKDLSILERALILSYLHTKQALANMEVVIVELRASKDERTGNLQHRYEKLLSATRKAFETIEKNITDKHELIEDLESTLDNNWMMLEQK